MSTADTMMPLISAPWLDTQGQPSAVRPLPGLSSGVIQTLECSYPGILTPAMKAVLGSCCGIAGTDLGSIDFTGCWFLEEPYAVFRPALTLAIDDAERRWIAEVGNGDLPGPVWCVFPEPEVAIYVCDGLPDFVKTLHEHTCSGQMNSWLQGLHIQARSLWSQRHALALRPHQARHADRDIRGWLLGLPFDAYIYDVRSPAAASGWPYGVAGPSGRLYRCGRLPVFAVAGLSAEGWRAPYPRARAAPIPEMPAMAEASFAIAESKIGRTHRFSRAHLAGRGRRQRRPTVRLSRASDSG